MPMIPAGCAAAGRKDLTRKLLAFGRRDLLERRLIDLTAVLADNAASVGGGAIGYYAMGGAALGKHVVTGVARDPEAVEFFSAYLPWLP